MQLHSDLAFAISVGAKVHIRVSEILGGRHLPRGNHGFSAQTESSKRGVS